MLLETNLAEIEMEGEQGWDWGAGTRVGATHVLRTMGLLALPN
jgi:hypothetical protein